MTHTLHRQGDRLAQDYIVLAMSAKGINVAGTASRLREFLRLARQFTPLNIGDMTSGNWLTLSIEELEARVHNRSIVQATFSSIDSVESLVRALQQADLGVSIVVSGLLDEVKQMCGRLGLEHGPHTVQYSLGIWGEVKRLPSPEILAITTMCGHGLVSARLVAKLVEEVRAGVTTPREAADRLARPCVCGIFNPARAESLLNACCREPKTPDEENRRL